MIHIVNGLISVVHANCTAHGIVRPGNREYDSCNFFRSELIKFFVGIDSYGKQKVYCALGCVEARPCDRPCVNRRAVGDSDWSGFGLEGSVVKWLVTEVVVVLVVQGNGGGVLGGGVGTVPTIEVRVWELLEGWWWC
jgi:hypothetical protein